MQILGAHAEVQRRDRLMALVWLLGFMVCAGFCFQQVAYHQPFHSNLLQLLPKDERNPVLHDLSELLAERFQDRLLILVKSDDLQTAYTQTQNLQTRLLASPHLEVDDSSKNLQQEFIRFYRPFSQQLLSAAKRQWLQTHTPEQLAEQTYRELFSPVTSPHPYSFAEDPFNLGGDWLASLAPELKLQDYHGFPLVKEDHDTGHSWLMITLKLKDSPFDIAVQRDVRSALNAFYAASPQAELLTSGMIFHAAAGTEQATQEINTVGLGSLLGIVILVVFVFRRALPLVAVLFTMSGAYILALTISLLVFGKIHIITLAFGSTLLGVAVDYAIHFLVSSQRQGSGLAARHHLRYAMGIGALTSMGAYLLQFFTPFPGLQQMAVFCSAGILGAWITVLALSPFYRITSVSAQAPLIAAAWFFRWGNKVYRPLWGKMRWVSGALLILISLALTGIIRGGTNDAVINLNTSPKQLLDSERQVQDILQQPSVSQFFFIEAETPEQLLIRTQQLNDALAQANLNNLHKQSLQQYLPSQTQQRADRELVNNKLYSEHGALALLCQRLHTQCDAPMVNDNLLTPEQLNASPLAVYLPPLINAHQTWYSLVTLGGNYARDKLDLLGNSIAGVRLVNQTDDLSQLLGRYRASVSKVLLLTLIILAIGLTLRYRYQSWRMFLPLLMAIVFAMGCAAAQGITLFHVMALLLVIGIGLDTAVFYSEGGFNAESWLASSLACATSILAFGLLSLSAVPVLHQFGLIILVGILSCWLLTPLFFRPQPTPDFRTSLESYNR